VYGDEQQRRCLGNVNDVVQAIIGPADTPQANGKLFNIGTNEEITIWELAERVKQRTGSTSEIITIPYKQAYEAGFEDKMRRIPDVGKLNRFIGWSPTTSFNDPTDQIIVYQRSRLALLNTHKLIPVKTFSCNKFDR
jgi:UDP-glucose 4-epimerase